MLKISVEIKEKDGEVSNVTVKVPKDVSKATDNEKPYQKLCISTF